MSKKRFQKASRGAGYSSSFAGNIRRNSHKNAARYDARIPIKPASLSPAQQILLIFTLWAQPFK